MRDIKYCDQCKIELHDKNSTESTKYCDECLDDLDDGMYEDFDE